MHRSSACRDRAPSSTPSSRPPHLLSHLRTCPGVARLWNEPRAASVRYTLCSALPFSRRCRLISPFLSSGLATVRVNHCGCELAHARVFRGRSAVHLEPGPLPFLTSRPLRISARFPVLSTAAALFPILMSPPQHIPSFKREFGAASPLFSPHGRKRVKIAQVSQPLRVVRAFRKV